MLYLSKSHALRKKSTALAVLHYSTYLPDHISAMRDITLSTIPTYSGPLHGMYSILTFTKLLNVCDTGGANEAVIRMLISIGSPENVPAFVEAVKRREKVLSGFGHR